MIILLKSKVATVPRNGAAAKAGLWRGILRAGQGKLAAMRRFAGKTECARTPLNRNRRRRT
ncbi:hypothetical protein [Phenylobacterium sp. 58.2.17]|uniref:hypothetical protein n=1 Tax=Phenylobacterium sp. 58.2.17 TaxID=2969306 RepID=UPI002264D7D5|nr:hypothetical protein [Phenylobacterium sp. 58.2.17]MCX7588459.1 hypothetical protein [Phenylobacterium sp. 58.2.17]